MTDFPDLSDDGFSNSNDQMTETLTPLLTAFFACLICFLCCCKTEETPDDPAFDRIGGIVGNPMANSTPPETLEEKRAKIDKALIKKEVVAAEPSIRPTNNNNTSSGSLGSKPGGKLMRNLSSSPRAYSSFFAAFHTRNSSKRKIVRFSEPVTAPLRRTQSAPSVALTNAPSRNDEQQRTSALSERLTSSTIGSGTFARTEEGETNVVEAQHQEGEPSTADGDTKEEPKEQQTTEEPPNDGDNVESGDDDKSDEEQQQDDNNKSLLRRRKSNIIARSLASLLRSGESDHDHPTTCDICLMDYEVGEQVAWSPNDACPHAFHTECITDWLLRNPTCPLCRNEYCHISHPEGEDHAHGDDQV
eukprot:CAMPEP_0194030434 /NCGR_PEP_ID=MMETSP0009_2-20130614/3922_1 /TAXON_ID=210454 /ORGANISM="Grammatophora oceanica, Strain CCMP 410" /LENGTH=359 /DNA_ID=CAMNT_0038670381 /DNA_START=245 /DNA_END=1324 /DNA_ORIENTATION=-